MITVSDAESIGTALLGRSPSDGERPWTLVEFGDGWLIRESSVHGTDMRGGAARVIERGSGQVVRFPSGVPSRRILHDYKNVRTRGKIEWQPDSGN